jgi:hypothetical protein
MVMTGYDHADPEERAVSEMRSTLYALYVYEPSYVELSTHETVRLDRLTFAYDDGWTAERHGDLVQPGTTTLLLAPGVYRFRATADAQVRLAHDSSVLVLTPPTTNNESRAVPACPA